MIRHPAWPERLARALHDARRRPFDWGSWNCCFFVAEIIEAMTDAGDLAAPWRGMLAGEADVQAALAREGGMETLWTRLLGMPIAPALAQRGDVALVPTAHGPAVGIIIGARIATIAPGGFAYLDLAGAIAAWRV